MEIRATEPEKVPVVELTFTFAHKVLTAVIWPTKGDTFDEHPWGWYIGYPRLKTDQRIYRGDHFYGIESTMGLRVFVDFDELKRRRKAKQDAEEEADAKVTGAQ